MLKKNLYRLYVIQEAPTIVAGMVHSKSDANDDVEFMWLACNENEPDKWFEISPWTKNNEWVSWTPETGGNYVLVCKARVVGNEEKSVISKSVGVTCHTHIKDKCQIPNLNGEGYLIGFETLDNPNQSYQYQMLIMDLSLYAQGLPCWVHDTGKITVSEGNALWSLWQPDYGYYITYFRLYDADGKLIDEVAYGFANAY